RSRPAPARPPGRRRPRARPRPGGPGRPAPRCPPRTAAARRRRPGRSHPRSPGTSRTARRCGRTARPRPPAAAARSRSRGPPSARPWPRPGGPARRPRRPGPARRRPAPWPASRVRPGRRRPAIRTARRAAPEHRIPVRGRGWPLPLPAATAWIRTRVAPLFEAGSLERRHAGCMPPCAIACARGVGAACCRAPGAPTLARSMYASAGVRVSTNPGDLQLLFAATAASMLLVALLFITMRRRQSERSYIERLRDREEQLKLALWATDERYWAYDVCSGRIHRLAGDSRATPSGELAEDVSDVGEVIHPDDLAMVRQRVDDYIAGHTDTFLAELRVAKARGEWVWMRARGRAVARDAQGRIQRIAGTALNITGTRAADRELRISSEVLRSMNEAVAVIDRNFDFVSVNPAF